MTSSLTASVSTRLELRCHLLKKLSSRHKVGKKSTGTVTSLLSPINFLVAGNELRNNQTTVSTRSNFMS